jgi:hypothetical protein
MYQLGTRDFDIDYQEKDFVSLLNTLRLILHDAGALNASVLVTPDTAPTNSPGCGGGGDA